MTIKIGTKIDADASIALHGTIIDYEWYSNKCLEMVRVVAGAAK